MSLSKLNDKYTFIEEFKFEDIDATAYKLEHNITKAHVIIIDTKDENKVFSIGFRTPPSDDTGVPHIIEHSVLCGSNKFPIKDPFVELIKGSLNTFLNAMTYPDKTIYPVASTNDKDFFNLMDVYLDAVFNPLIYKKKEIFMQEGWRREVDDKDNLSINGVVYSEMKGVFSLPDSILEREVMRTLYPNSPYVFESGGDPDSIINLTYEEFLDFHRKYYHPSNSYIYLYGDIDFNKYLEYIHNEYLSKYEYKFIDSEIKVDKNLPCCTNIVKEFPTNSNNDDEYYYLSNYVIDFEDDPLMRIAFNVIDEAVFSSKGSEIEKALINSGFAKDLECDIDNDVMYPYYCIKVKGCKGNLENKFIDIVDNTLKDIVKNGIDKKSLEAAINKFEFIIRENDTGRLPKGLMYNIVILREWIYKSENTFIHLNNLKILDELRKKIDTDFFEKVLEKYFITNEKRSIIIGKPSKEFEKNQIESFNKMISDMKSKLSKDDLLKIQKDNEDLLKYQRSIDKKEDIDKIPRLKPSDIDKNPKPLDYTLDRFEYGKILYNNPETNGILYLDVLFPLKNINEQTINYLSLIERLLINVDTKNYTYKELNDVINIQTGGIIAKIDSFYDKKTKKIKTYLHIEGKCFKKDYKKLLYLISEIVTNSKFDDTKRIKEIIDSHKISLHENILSAGHIVSARRAASHFNPISYIYDRTSGITAYKYYNNISKDHSKIKDKLSNDLKKFYKDLFTSDDLVINISGFQDIKDEIISELSNVLKPLTCKKSNDLKIDKIGIFKNEDKSLNEAFIIPSKIQYVALAGRYNNNIYNGANEVLITFLNYEYLWQKVRVEGGAYGCSANVDFTGHGFMTSYRDPLLDATINSYKNAYKTICKQIENADVDTINKYIIGSFSKTERPMSPKELSDRNLIFYESGLDFDDLVKKRHEQINANKEMVINVASILDELTNDANICIIGSKEAIDKSDIKFDNIEVIE